MRTRGLFFLIAGMICSRTALQAAPPLALGQLVWGANGHLDQGGPYTALSITKQAADLKAVFGAGNTILYRALTDKSDNNVINGSALTNAGINPICLVCGYPANNFSGFNNKESNAYTWAYNKVAPLVHNNQAIRLWEIGNEWTLQITDFSGNGSVPANWTSCTNYHLFRGVMAGAIAAIRDNNTNAQVIGGATSGWTELGLPGAFAPDLTNYVTPGGVTRNLMWDFTVLHWYNDIAGKNAGGGPNKMGDPANYNGGMNAYHLLYNGLRPLIITEFGSSDGNVTANDAACGVQITNLMTKFMAHMNATGTERGIVGGTAYQMYQMPGVQTDYFLDYYTNAPTTAMAAEAAAVKDWVTFNPTVGTGATLTTTTAQAAGDDWTSAIWQMNGTGTVQVPIPGNFYECIANGNPFGTNGDTRIRSPQTAGTYTFPGDRLTVDADAEIRFSTDNPGTNLFPGVHGNPGLILNGGVLHARQAGTIVDLGGVIQVAAPSYFSTAVNGGGAYEPGALFLVSAQLTGGGNLVIFGGDASNTNQFSCSSNSFTGQWIVDGGCLLGSATNALGTNSITVNPLYDLGLNLVTNTAGPAWLEVNYDLNSAGTLTITNGGKMRLHQNCCFNAVNLEGTTLTAGTHLYSELTGRFPGTFASGGSGSITVQAYGQPPGLLTTISSQPQPLVLVTGQIAQFSVSANGLAPFTYSWRKNGVSLGNGGNVSGAQTANLTLSNIGAGDAANYDVVVSNAFNSTTSRPASLVVLSTTGGYGTVMLAATYADKLRGAELLKLIGDASGAPSQGDYVSLPDPDDAVPWVVDPAWLADETTGTEWVFLHMMEVHGPTLINYSQIAFEWQDHFQSAVSNANLAALNLMLDGMLPPMTGGQGTNSYWNDMSLQFEGGFFGQIAPGMSANARTRADYWGRIVNDGNAVDAGKFVSMMAADAFTTSDPVQLVAHAKTAFSSGSLTWQMVTDVQNWHGLYPDWRDCRQQIQNKYYSSTSSPLPWHSCEINFCAQLMALLYGQGDVKNTLQIAALAGWDSECNMAAMGAIMGTICGYSGLPPDFVSGAGDSYHNLAFSDLPEWDSVTNIVAREQRLAEINLLAQGGQIMGAGDSELYYISDQPFVPPAQPVSLSVTYEGEDLPVTTSAGISVNTVADTGGSAGAWSQVNATAPGDWAQYTVIIPTPGTYDLRIITKNYTPRGISQLYVNGVAQGGPVDEYAAGVLFVTNDLGNLTITNGGPQLFKFLVTGKNSQSTAYRLGIDALILSTPSTGNSFFECENLPATASAGDTQLDRPNTLASNGTNNTLLANGVGDYVTYAVNVPVAGTYQIGIGSILSSSNAQCQLSVDGIVLGAAIDQYNASNASSQTSPGLITFFTAGTKLFTFTVTGKNAASSGYTLGNDYVSLVRNAASPAPFHPLLVIRPAGSPLVFSGAGGAPGGLYVLEHNSQLAGGVWLPCATNSTTAAGTWSVTNDFSGSDPQFFRARQQ